MATTKRNFKVNSGLEVADSAVISGTLTASGLSYPTSDGDVDDVVKTDGSGNLSLGKLTLNNLGDVDIQSLQEGGLLQYDSASNRFVASADETRFKTQPAKINSDGGFF
jgi:hypothetical protein